MIVKPNLSLPKAHRSCRTASGKRKVPYPSKRIAKKAAGITQSSAAEGRNARPLRPYRCHVCAFWHVGHDESKRK